MAMTSEIKLTVHLDENKVPERIDWEAEDGGARSSSKAVLLALWSYVLLAGAGPAVVRAAVLFSLLTYAVLSNRQGQSLHFWALALLILLGVVAPSWLFQAGFQLSFAAVWAILVIEKYENVSW